LSFRAAEVRDLVSRLVEIDSVNPDLVPGGAGEAEIAAFVGRWLAESGLEVDFVEPAPGRPSVVGVARGSGGGPALMLNAHLDTVGAGGMREPHRPRLERGRLHGRGAYDMKGGLAAVMLAGRELGRSGLAGDVVVAAVADEEVASMGTASVLRSWSADAAIVTEPTGLELCVAHKGFAWLEVETEGRAAHGSRPDLGVDAIAKMGRVLAGLEELDRELRSGPRHPLLGSGSLHASLIEGGQELSSYPQRCLLSVERRTVPGESPGEVLGQVRTLLERAAAADPELRAQARLTLVRDPFEVPEDARVVTALRRGAARVLGREPRLVGETPWMDSALLSAAGIPTAVFGPAGEGAHADVEWVDLESVALCAEALVEAGRELCSRARSPG
jgi:acetylornithine deacetylase